MRSIIGNKKMYALIVISAILGFMIFTTNKDLSVVEGIGGGATASTENLNTTTYGGTDMLDVDDVRAGESFSLILTRSGYVYSFGSDSYGRLGNGDLNNQTTPLLVTNANGFINGTATKVDAGWYHSLMATEDGTVYSFGFGANGRLGTGNNTNQAEPVKVLDNGTEFINGDSSNKVVDVSASWAHSLILTENGTVYGFGFNGEGRLGNNSTVESNVPVKIADNGTEFVNGDPNNKVVKISAGDHHSLILTEDGTVYSFGRNNVGQLGIGNTVNSSIPKKVASTADFNNGDSSNKVVDISAGEYHSLILTEDGTTYGFGSNGSRQIGTTVGNKNVPTKLEVTTEFKNDNVTSISAGFNHSLLTTKDGTAYGFGANGSWQLGTGDAALKNTATKLVDGTSYVNGDADNITVQVSAGYSHSLILTDDGQTYGVGNNGSGQLGTGNRTSVNRASLIDTSNLPKNPLVSLTGPFDSEDHGVNTYSSLVRIHNVSAFNGEVKEITLNGVDITSEYKTGGSVYNVTENGKYTLTVNDESSGSTVVDFVIDSTISTEIIYGGTEKIIDISAGENYSLALSENGVVYSFGLDTNGRLGNGTEGNVNKPTRVVDANGFVNGTVVKIETGLTHALILTEDGTVYSFGNGANGRLGNGSNNLSQVPVKVVDKNGFVNGDSSNKVIDISAGWGQSLVLMEDGTVYGFGYNGNGRLGNGTFTETNVPVRVSNNSSAGFTNGDSSNKVVGISTGYAHSLIVTEDGTVYGFGYDANGRLGNGMPAMDSNIPVKVSDNGADFINGNPNDKVVQVSAGTHHSLLVTESGTVYSFGWGGNGRLGTGALTDEYVPKKVTDENGFVNGNPNDKVLNASAGEHHSIVVTESGMVYSFGYNANGRLGNDSRTESQVPVKVTDANGFVNGEGINKVTKVSAGFSHSLVLTENGVFYGFGDNVRGQFGSGTNSGSDVAVKFDNSNLSVGPSFTLTGNTNNNLATKVKFNRHVILSDIVTGGDKKITNVTLNDKEILEEYKGNNEKFTIYREGTYTLEITDSSGTVVTVEFEIDYDDSNSPTAKLKVDGVLQDVVEGETYFYNKDVEFVLDDDFSGVDLEYSTNTDTLVATKDNEGKHTYVIKDYAGNELVFYVGIDVTIPNAKLNVHGYDIFVEDGETYYYNADVDFEFSDSFSGIDVANTTSDATMTVAKDEGFFKEYTITDIAKNKLTFKVMIDTTIPSGTITSGTDSFLIVDGVEYYVNEDTDFTITVGPSGIDESKSDYVTSLEGVASNEKKHTYSITSMADVGIRYFVVMDITPPEVKLTSGSEEVVVQNNGEYYLGDDVEFVVSDDLSGVNASTIPSTLIANSSNEGLNSYTIKDKAGNEVSFDVYIDVSKPTATLTVDGVDQVVTHGETYYYNKDVTIAVSDSGSEIDSEKSTDTSGILTATDNDGTYEYTIFDKAGNKLSFNIVIDTVVPEVILFVLAFPVTVEEGKTYYYNADVEFSFTDALSGIDDTLTTDDATIVASGNNNLKKTYEVYDKASNKLTFTVGIDTTIPGGYLHSGGKSYPIVDGARYYFNDDVTFEIIAGSSGIDEDRSTYPDVLKAIDENSGEHDFTAISYANSYVRFFIEMDATPPSVTLKVDGVNYSVENGGTYYYNKDVEFIVSDAITGVDHIKSTSTDILEAIAANEGSHSYVIYDKATNKIEFEVVIDLTLPVASLSVDGTDYSVVDEDVYHFSKDVSFDVSDALSGVDVEKSSDVSNLVASKVNEKTHVYTIYDKAGNKLTFTITIDLTTPEIKLKSNGVEAVAEEEGIYYFNADVSFVVEGGLSQINLDESSDLSTLISNSSNEKTHEYTIVDKAGNTLKFKVVIDITSPKAELNVLGQDIEVEEGRTYYYKDDVEASFEDSLSGFDSDSSTFVQKIAASSNNGKTTNYIIKDKAGNTLTFSILIDTTIPGGNLIKDGEKHQIIDGKTYYFNGTVTFDIVAGASGIDANNSDYPSLLEATSSTQGQHTYVVSSLAGSKVKFNVVIDIELPTVSITDGVKRYEVEEGKEYYYNKDVEFSTDDGLSGIDFVNSNDLSTLEALKENEGRLDYVVVDKAGNKVTFVIVMDISKPTVILSVKEIDIEVEDGGLYYYKDDVDFRFEDLLSGINTEKSSEPNTLKAVDNNNGILSYTVVDNAGNVLTFNIGIDTNIPSGTITVENGVFEILDGGRYHINKDASISIIVGEIGLDENNSNYVEYVEANKETEGVYEYTLVNMVGVGITYYIVVDVTMPTATVIIGDKEIDVTNNGTYYFNQVVEFEYDDNLGDVEVEITNASVLRSVEGSFVYKVTDEAGNILTFNVIIDLTMPTAVITVDGIEVEIENGKVYKYNKNVSISAVDTLSGIDSANSTALDKVLANKDNEGVRSYTIVDKSGNKLEFKVSIDVTAPNISLSTTEKIEFRKGSTAPDWKKYFTVEDEIDGTIIVTDAMLDLSAVNMNKEGTFAVLLKVVDSHGNTATKEFNVEIINTMHWILIALIITTIVMSLILLLIIVLFKRRKRRQMVVVEHPHSADVENQQDDYYRPQEMSSAN